MEIRTILINCYYSVITIQIQYYCCSIGLIHTCAYIFISSKMKTTSILEKFVIVEHFFFINRSYLIKDAKSWLFCNIVYVTITCSVVCSIIFDIVYPEEESHVGLRVIQIMAAWETLHLIYAAKSRKTFIMLDIIDETCSDVNVNLSKLNDYVSSAILYLIIVTLIDSAGYFIVNVTPSLFLTFLFGAAAHDSEMIFYTLLIKAFSLKLSVLEKLDPMVGAKIYGNILLGTANLSAEFYMRVLVMLGSTFMKTVIYLVLYILSDYQINLVVIYLAFREFRAIYAVWMLCTVASESDRVCQRLTFHLASTLVLDPNINKYPRSPQYNAVCRWLRKISENRPKYITGSIITIDLAVPLHIFDLGISYTLIVVQMYTAFF